MAPRDEEQVTDSVRDVLATPTCTFPAHCYGSDTGRSYCTGPPLQQLYCSEEADYLDSVDMDAYYSAHTGQHWGSDTWYDAAYIPPQPQRLNFGPPSPPHPQPLSARAPSPPSQHHWATYSSQHAHTYQTDDTATLAELCGPATLPPNPPASQTTPLKAKAQRKRSSEEAGAKRVVRRRSEGTRPDKVQVERGLKALAQQQQLQVQHMVGQHVADLLQLLLSMQPHLQAPTAMAQPQGEGEVEAKRLRDRRVLEGMLGLEAQWLHVEVFSTEQHERLTLRLQQHLNQVRYLASTHQAQRRSIRAPQQTTVARNTAQAQVGSCGEGVAVASCPSMEADTGQGAGESFVAVKAEPGTQAEGEAGGEDWRQLAALIKQETGHGSDDVIQEPETDGVPSVMHMVTPLRPSPDGEDLLVSYCGHWVTPLELQTITRANLVPFVSAGAVRWMEGQAGTALASADSHVCEVYTQAITEYPLVFKAVDTRKTLISKRALAKVIAHNPAAVGLGTRRTYVEEGAAWAKMQGGTGQRPITDLLNDLESGVLRRSSKFFPSTSMRTPFATIEEAHEQLRLHLGSHMPPGFSPPTLDAIRETVERGKERGFDMWYQRFNEIIFDGCMGVESEMNFFLSLLATASPNSGVYQNTLNALLNFRALSQDSRPRWGSYPARNLVNYLAGTLGAPSGMKIAAFLSNLVQPSYSQAVTIDTHMQRHALGVGHLSLLPHQYAILEDFYRCAANQLNENPPHRLQAAIWCTLAGPYSFKEELQQCRRSHTFRLLPDQTTWEARGGHEHVHTISAILHTPHGRRLACTLLRRKLLDIGYMSWLPEPTPGMEDSWADVTLTLFVPIRKQHPTSIRSHINMRRSYARRQTRSLLAEEEMEAQQQMQVLSVAERAGDGLIDNLSDQRWFERDMAMVRAWLLLEGEGSSKATQQAMQAEERDPYFKTHAHFAGVHVHPHSLPGINPAGLLVMHAVACLGPPSAPSCMPAGVSLFAIGCVHGSTCTR